MKRLLAAITLALILHGLFFTMDLELTNNKVHRIADLETISISLNYPEPEKPALITKKESQDRVLPEKKPSPPSPPPKTVKKMPVKKPEIHTPAAVKKKEPFREINKIRQEVPTLKRPQEEKPLFSPSDAIDTDSGSPTRDKESSAPEKQANIPESIRDKKAAPSPPVTKLAIPAYKENPAPEYPRKARRRGIQGVVLLDVFVDEEGKVQELHVGESSGHEILDNAAMDAVRKWIFIPGTRNDDPIAVWVKVPIRFQMK